jgi:dephospho-CoA kinase
MKWIGLTGGIACGKSSVTRLLKNAAKPIIDADEIAREVVEVGSPGLKAVVSEFSRAMLLPDGSLDRKALGAVTFSNPANRKKLEDILHPLIRARTDELRAQLAKQGEPFAIYDIPLLFETHSESQFDGIVVVSCRPEQQRERLRLRNHLTEQEINDRLAAQMPLRDKVAKANFVVDNSGDQAHLEQEVARLLQWLQK